LIVQIKQDKEDYSVIVVNKMVSVSVIVPCFNVVDCVHRCIEALICQSVGLENIEIILIDDASTDDGATLSILMEYEKKFTDNIMVIALPENLHQGGARNVGISYASGKYILFCDADDWIHETTIEKLLSIAEAYDCDVVEYEANSFSDFENIPECSYIEGAKDYYVDIASVDIRKSYLLSRESTYGCMYKMYKASLIKDNNIKFPEHVFLEEPGFIMMTRLYEKRHFFHKERLHYNYLRPESTMRGSFSNKRFDNMITYLDFMNSIKGSLVYNTYKEELDYFFWKGCFFKTLALAASADMFFSPEEYALIQQNTSLFTANIADNKYYKDDFSKYPAVAALTYCNPTAISMEQVKDIIMHCRF